MEACSAGEFVVGDPVAGEDDGVAVDRASGVGVEVFDLDGADAALADDAGDAGAGSDGDLQRESSGDGERGVGLGRGVCAGHQDGLAVRFAQCDRGGPADQFGADDDGACAGGAVVQVYEVLQLAGGVDAGGAVAGDEPGGAGSFAGAGGEDDRAGVMLLAPVGAGDLDGARRRPSR